MVYDWYSITYTALQNLGQSILAFIPNLIGAIIVFTIGWFIAIAIAKLVVKVLDGIKLNQFFEKSGWKDALEKADLKVNVSEFIGAIVKWIFVIVFLLAAVEILGFSQFAVFLKSVISWLPNLFVAAVIFVVAVIMADILEKIIRAWVEQMKIGYASAIGAIVRWSVWVFAILAILRQLLVVPSLIDTVFSALVYGAVTLVVISCGIAFGLGGKDVAAEILQEIREKLRK